MREENFLEAWIRKKNEIKSGNSDSSGLDEIDKRADEVQPLAPKQTDDDAGAEVAEGLEVGDGKRDSKEKSAQKHTENVEDGADEGALEPVEEAEDNERGDISEAAKKIEKSREVITQSRDYMNERPTQNEQEIVRGKEIMRPSSEDKREDQLKKDKVREKKGEETFWKADDKIRLRS